MTQKDFEAKLRTLPREAPDAQDTAMLAQADAINDGTTVSLEELKRDLEEYSGRFVLRLPRSLHKQLKQAAAVEGVSLNQYMLYKLSR